MKNNKKIYIVICLVFTMLISMVQPVFANDKEKEEKEVKTKNNTQHEKKQIPLLIMYYCDADNNLEPYLMENFEKMVSSINKDVKIVALVDRIEGYATNGILGGDDFIGTKLYEISYDKKAKKGVATSISGSTQFPEIRTKKYYEANMGDAKTLAKFIEFCKANYPSKKNTLILSNHGGGSRSYSEDEHHKAVCWDDTNDKDALYTSEISEVLNKSHSVDLLGFDACFMGSAEVAYQFRPGNGSFEAKVMVASSPKEWASGWKYNNILERIKTTAEKDNGEDDKTMGKKEKYYSPNDITALQLGGIIVEEQRDSTTAAKNIKQQLSCYDLTKAADIKKSVDKLAIALHKDKEAKIKLEKLRGPISRPIIMKYYDNWNAIEERDYPFFDLYDLARKISEATANAKKVIKGKPTTVKKAVFSKDIQDKAKEVINAIDSMIVYSFAGSLYKGFTDGKNGVHIFFPDGKANYYERRKYSSSYITKKHWSYQWWYSPLDTQKVIGEGKYYGKIKWCQDGLDKKVNTVGNWFELLDAWYDKDNKKDGGYNKYQW